jgi:hypothetical protein
LQEDIYYIKKLITVLLLRRFYAGKKKLYPAWTVTSTSPRPVVKGIEFKQIRYAGEPVELATKYYEDGADEIVFLTSPPLMSVGRPWRM